MSGDAQVRFCERLGVRFPRATHRNVYVKSRQAGERVKASLTRFLNQRLRLKVNEAKSAVARPWQRKFLGYSMTFHKKPRLKVAEASVKRLKEKIRALMRAGRGQSLGKVITTLQPLLRGWMAYFGLVEVKGVFEELDQWLRRKLRCILWRQWKRPRTRAMKLRQRGLAEDRVHLSAGNGRGPWWNAGASHMNAAFPASFFTQLGLLSLLQMHYRLQSTL